jgi:ubiquinone/menaquinone biosynthesis C-methylase UbiE
MEMQDVWSVGDAYERFMGRWSRLVARDFLAWLGAAPRLSWLDIGCGTGALSGVILADADPARVVGFDSSAEFVQQAQTLVAHERVRFEVADAATVPLADHEVDITVSGLMLNFVPQPAQVVTELARVTRPGGLVAAYVWDYAEGMAMLRHFWDAAVDVDAGAVTSAEGHRFALCEPNALAETFSASGLAQVQTRDVTVPTVFSSFADFWQPFLGGVGPAGGYLVSQPAPVRDRIAEVLRSRLPTAADGSIPLTARAWAVRGRVGQGMPGTRARSASRVSGSTE